MALRDYFLNQRMTLKIDIANSVFFLIESETIEMVITMQRCSNLTVSCHSIFLNANSSKKSQNVIEQLRKCLQTFKMIIINTLFAS